MMHILLAVVTVVASGFLYRHRGGWIPTGHTQLARADFCLGMALLIYMSTREWRLALASIPLYFLGSLASNGEWMNIANREQFFHGVISGAINVGPVVAAAVVFSHYELAATMLLSGAVKGPLYLAAKFLPLRIPQFHQGPEMGEFLFGLALGAGLLG